MVTRNRRFYGRQANIENGLSQPSFLLSSTKTTVSISQEYPSSTMANPTPLLNPVNGRDKPDIDVPRIQGEIRRLKS